MSRRMGDRRRVEHPVRLQPRRSPANLLILTVVAVLGASAAAAAVMDTGFDDVTPHGQVLGELHRVAEAQERYHTRHGTFAGWTRTLGLEPSAGVRVTIIRGDHSGWEAVATHDVGLSCVQRGEAEGAVLRRDRPACFTTEP